MDCGHDARRAHSFGSRRGMVKVWQRRRAEAFATADYPKDLELGRIYGQGETSSFRTRTPATVLGRSRPDTSNPPNILASTSWTDRSIPTS
jgi:hypothetical protein